MVISQDNQVIFEDQLLCLNQTRDHGSVPNLATAILTAAELTWLEQSIPQKLSLADVVGAEVSPQETQSGMARFVVHTYPLVQVHRFSRQRRRVHRVYQFGCRDAQVRSQWLSAIHRALHPEWGQDTAPRHLVVLLNPVSGQRQAKHIFKKVRPLLEQGNLRLTVLEMQGGNLTGTLIKTLELADIDGFVIVGGDGTVYETINGLMRRADWKTAIQTPLGIIPAGTGNGLSKTVLDISGEPYDPISAAFLIVKGKQRRLDIATIEQDSRRFYSVLSLSWALVSEVDIKSEQLRWLGALRNDLYTLIEICRLRAYYGKFSFLPHPGWHQFSLGMGWQTIEDDFVVFWAMNIPWAAQTVKAAPQAQLADGALDVLVIRRGVSRWQLLMAFLRTSTGTHVSLPYVDYYKVRGLSLHPTTRPGILAVDGEQVDYRPMRMEVMPGLSRVFCG